MPERDPPDDDPAPSDPADSGSVEVALSNPRLPVSPGDSLEVQFSSTRLPAVAGDLVGSDRLPAMSGSMDVQFSQAHLPAVNEDGTPVGPVIEPLVERRKRPRTISELAEDLGNAVVHAGDAVVDRVVHAGERAGESLTHLPVASAIFPKTRSGRVMARSVVVSFLLVFSWIAVIVGLQLRRPRPPDFRPLAQATLIAIRDGQAREVYRDASTRFQEVVLEDIFVAQMEDLNRTLGKYKEVTAVLALATGRGPSGRTGRLDFSADYENGSARGSVSFRWEDNRWKVLGFAVDVPLAVAAAASTDAMRARRVRGPEAELKRAAEEILILSAQEDYAGIWNRAAVGFQQSITKENFRETESDRRKVLGPFLRILNVTSATQNPNGTGASIQLLVEFEKATITGGIDFTKIDDVWKMTRYKLVLPLPRVPAWPRMQGAG